MEIVKKVAPLPGWSDTADRDWFSDYSRTFAKIKALLLNDPVEQHLAALRAGTTKDKLNLG